MRIIADTLLDSVGLNSVETPSIRESAEHLALDIVALENLTPDMHMGSEGLWTFFKSVLASISDSMRHAQAIFNSDVLSSYTSIKKTELREYISRNSHCVDKAFSLQYISIKDSVMPYPTGMVCKYLIAVGLVKTALHQIDIGARTRNAVSVVDKILDSIKYRKDMDNSIYTSLSVTDNGSFIESSKRAAGVYNPNVQAVTTKQFGQLFDSMSDFKTCFQELSSLESIVMQTGLAHKGMDVCQKKFSEIVRLSENDAGKTLTKTDVENLAKVAYNLACMFDTFSSVLKVYHILEHNFVEIFAEIDRLSKD